MSRIADLNRRYEACAQLARDGIEVVSVGDTPGARVDAATFRLMRSVQDDEYDIWADLIGALKSLRWRLITHAQPIAFNDAVAQAVRRVEAQIDLLGGAVANHELLAEVRSATTSILESDPAVGHVLLRCVDDARSEDCVVVVANKSAQVGMSAWLSEHGRPVLVAREFLLHPAAVGPAYVVGPPRFMPASIVTAPTTADLTFLVPSWFRDHSVPRSAIAAYAEGALRVPARIVTEGVHEDVDETAEAPVADDYLPEPDWGPIPEVTRPPMNDEVEARKVLLSGGYAIWLDDGDRIRALDPSQPVGERVVYEEVDTVKPGTILILRHGETERGALYQEALALLGKRATPIEISQDEWKSRLRGRLAALGNAEVVRQLRSAGVKTADRARAWTDPNLIRPHSDGDFELLLRWLDLSVQPAFGYATSLRKKLYQASADVREKLEDALAAADLTNLEHSGHLSLTGGTDGIRGILATQVLARSPFTQLVPRYEARVPFEDGGGKWLE